MKLYIDEEGYLSYDVTVYDGNNTNGLSLLGKPIGLRKVRFKVGEDGLFKEVK